MSKEEFLRILRIKISGSMAPQEVESQIDYYSAYIDGEIMKGKTEAEVIEELGDPTLIAKTLTAAMKRSSEEIVGEENYNNSNAYGNDYSDEMDEGPQSKARVFKASGAGCIIAFIVVLLIIFLLIFLIIKFSFTIIGFLWPVILVLVIGGIIFGLIRRR